MLTLKRADNNPILTPLPEHDWEAKATYNPCVIHSEGTYHMLYRALAPKKELSGVTLELSTIGYAVSTNGSDFEQRTLFIKPEYEWEKYGCEDPRVTKIGDTYYIFYTALSTFPFTASGIKVGVALTKDFKTIEAKHLVTPFNAKAMTLFPEKINNTYAAFLTADTDQPPAKIALAYFDKIEEMWDVKYWDNWYRYIGDHTLKLRRSPEDHVEIGAPPLKTAHGWLLIYSYISNYFTDHKDFGVEAAMLRITNPLAIISRTTESLLSPEKDYERNGNVANIVFPSGAIHQDNTLSVYYGGADTVSCLATCNLSALNRDLTPEKQSDIHITTEIGTIAFQRFEENPIITPNPDHSWESTSTCNPGAVRINGTTHLVYHAQSDIQVSTFGYAISSDGFHISERLTVPVYTPYASFEMNDTGRNIGCEDPRVTMIDDRVYVCYTARDRQNPAQAAVTSIALSDFLSRTWKWDNPHILSSPGVSDTDLCLFPKKIENNYVFLHQLEQDIWIDSVADLVFTEGKTLKGEPLVKPRHDKWDNTRIGIAAPPLETQQGWLLLYHGRDAAYRYNVGALLMDLENPKHILSRLDYPLFIPETEYERIGNIPDMVYPCGATIQENKLIMYYGAANTVTGVASLSLVRLLEELNRYQSSL